VIPVAARGRARPDAASNVVLSFPVFSAPRRFARISPWDYSVPKARAQRKFRQAAARRPARDRSSRSSRRTLAGETGGGGALRRGGVDARAAGEPRGVRRRAGDGGRYRCANPGAASWWNHDRAAHTKSRARRATDFPSPGGRGKSAVARRVREDRRSGPLRYSLRRTIEMARLRDGLRSSHLAARAESSDAPVGRPT
jgi:hypothetical protein